MLNRALPLLLAGCLMSGTLCAADNPFVGKWKVIPSKSKLNDKMKGRTLLTAYWTLSEDGNMLSDAFTQYLPDGTTLFSQPLPDGSTLFLPYLYERTAGNSDFLGT